MANLPLAFAELLAGAVVIDAGIKGDSIANVIRGVAKQQPLPGAGSGSTGSTGSTGGGNPFAGGWQPSRADQGYDGTFSGQLTAPVSGTVTYASSSDPGWKGGGAVVLQADQAISGLASSTFYFTEGLLPSVKAGQHVSAGQPIATPAVNPYNGTPGNIEWGLAPQGSTSATPLAQSVANPRAMVMQFIAWAEQTLGLPAPTSTSGAGYA